jgi:hypothetical protein
MPDKVNMDEINPQCPHTALTPHWDNVDDMGKKEAATYTCEACGDKFTYEQAQQYLENAPSIVASLKK